MVERSGFLFAVGPLLRLVVVFGIVTFYRAVLGQWLTGAVLLGCIIGLSFVTWIAVAKFVFEPFVETLEPAR